MSQTFNKCNLGIVTKGSWLGEENCLLDGSLPQLYSAIGIGEVKAFALDREEFMSKFPPETKQEMENAVYGKLQKLREKLQAQNQMKRKVELMDYQTANLARTMNHMQQIYPLSNLSMQKKMNRNYNEKANGNALKIMALMNGENERLREETEVKLRQERKAAKQSFKSVIHNKQKLIFQEY